MTSGNSSSPPIFVILGGVLLMLYIAFSVLLGGGNAIGSLFFYLLILGVVFGLAAPHKAFYFFLFQCGYLDLAKRIMIMDGAISFTDLYWVLGVAPATLAGVTAGLVVKIFFGQIQADRGDLARLVLVACIIGGGSVGSYAAGNGIGGTAKVVSDAYFYSVLIFIVPLLFRTAEAVRSVWLASFWIFLPVAVYGIYQQLAGFQDFEIDYLKTGLSIEVKQLVAERVRAFSTLNSPTSLSVMGVELATAALLMGLQKRNPKLGLAPLLTIILVPIFLGAWVASTVRVGILLLPVACIASWQFRTPMRTVAFYALSAVLFVSLVAISPYVLINIDNWTIALMDIVGNNPFIAQLLEARTYKDRLMGFSNVLANPSAYSFFGQGDQQADFYNHDPLSAALLKVGALPLAFVLIFLIFVLRQIHATCLRIADPAIRQMAIMCLSIAMGAVAVSMVGGNLLTSFPCNVFFAIPIGMIFALRRADTVATTAAAAPPLQPQQGRYPQALRPPGWGPMAPANRPKPRPLWQRR